MAGRLLEHALVAKADLFRDPLGMLNIRDRRANGKGEGGVLPAMDVERSSRAGGHNPLPGGPGKYVGALDCRSDQVGKLIGCACKRGDPQTRQ